MNEFPTPFSGGYSQDSSGMGGFNPLAMALGSIAGGFGSLMAKNPADSAMPYLNGMQGMLNQYYSPYISQGQQAYGTLNNYMNRGDTASNALMGQYGSLISNPTGEMNAIGSTFHSSPGYNWQLGQALNAANRVASAGGMAGSPEEQQQAATVAQGLSNQDYYNYLNHGIGMYNTGLQGLGNMANYGYGASSDIYGQGANMSNQLAQMMMANKMSQANLAYNGAINQNQSTMGGIGSIISGIGDLL